MERLLARGLWLCPVLLLVLAVVLIMLGVNWRTALVSTALFAGPIALAWTVVADPLSRREVEQGPEKRGT